MPHRTTAIACLALFLLPGLVDLVAAQTSTGRHRVPQNSETEKEVTSRDGERQADWILYTGAGLGTSGDVARLQTAGASGISWTPPGGQPFASEEFQLTLDENFALAVGFGRRLAEQWWLRLDLGLSDIDLAAEARVGEVVESFRWDRLGLLTASAGLEFQISRQVSHPYLMAGFGIVKVTADGDSQFDQTRASLRLGAGYQQHLIQDWSLRFEVRDALATLNLDDYVPPVEGDLIPNYRLDQQSPLHVFELLVLLAGAF